MATANDLLTRAIDETKHLNHNEIFLVRDLFKGYEWNRISRSDLIISLDVLICRYSPLFRAFPALFISEEPHKSFYYPSCFRSQK